MHKWKDSSLIQDDKRKIRSANKIPRRKYLVQDNLICDIFIIILFTIKQINKNN